MSIKKKNYMSLITFEEGMKNYFFLNLLQNKKTTTLSYSTILRIILFFSLFPVTNYLGALTDNTLFMANNGKGLFQHYGVWAFYITNPIIFLLILVILKRFYNIVSNVKNYLKDKKIDKKINTLCIKNIDSIFLRNKNKYILYLMHIVGVMFSIVNIFQTIEPVKIFGNDVFDSFPYFWGFLANKIHLSFVWSYLYPITFFIILHVTISIMIILKYIYKNNLLKLDVFSSDGCGGISEFGTLNMYIMLIYALLFSVMISLAITHTNNHFTLILPIIISSIVFIVQSFAGVYYVHKIVSEEKNELLKNINELLRKNIYQIKEKNDFPAGLIFLRKYVLSLKSYPYTKVASFVVNSLRLLPALLALGKLMSLR